MRAEPLPRLDAPLVRLTIDNLAVAAPEGTSVLHAAEAAGIFIPSLCAHKELSPFGSCRLCAVEIEGMPGHSLACSTLAADGMRVTTDSPALRANRREVLELILSQHPSSCLICEQRSACERSQETIHKAGVATGCHSCTNDGDCELQLMVERIGIRDIAFPITYRALEPELDDPFYDRDYNLCILCGRCVRMCQEVRGTAVLAFKYRGRKTLIGPAFGESHTEAGCEYCGACVTVCPTGALSERVSKWDGSPDGRQTSTCPFCSLGCQLDVAYVHGRLSSARGAPDPDVGDGQLCVRGAFCLPETTHHYSRARKPMLRQGPYFRVADWEEALTAVSARLREVAPEDFLMLLSGDLPNEALYSAQRLVRDGLGSPGVDSTLSASLPGGPRRWMRLFALPVSLQALSQADAVVIAGLDARFSFSVVGVQVRRALRRGATIVTVDARDSNLAVMADHRLQPRPGTEARATSALLRAIMSHATPDGAPDGAPDGVPDRRALRRLGLGARPFADAVNAVEAGGSLAVVIGPRVFDGDGADRLVADLERLAERPGVTVVPLTLGTNIRGALELGALANVLPGPRPAGADVSADASRDFGRFSLASLDEGRRPQVLYLVGETPFTTRPDADFVIAQDLYLPPFEVDAFLPAASFAEADGTLTNLEGRVQAVHAVESSSTDAAASTPRPDWQVFSELAARLGRPDLQYQDAAAVRAAIHAELPRFPAEPDRRPRRLAFVGGPVGRPGSRPAPSGDTEAGDEHAPAGSGRFLLVPERAGFRHRGIDLAGVVEGLGELRLEEGLRLCPDDMERLCVCDGEPVTVRVSAPRRLTVVLPARSDPGCPRGAAFVTLFDAWGARPVDGVSEALSRLPARPVRVRISAGDRTRPGAAPSAAGDRTQKAGGAAGAGTGRDTPAQTVSARPAHRGHASERDTTPGGR